MQLFRLLVIALAACSSTRAESDRPNFTPYRCDGIVAAPQNGSVDPAIVAPWRALATSGSYDEAWAARVFWHSVERPARLSIGERVHLQHQLIVVARRLDGLRRSNRESEVYRAAHRSVMQLVRDTAPTADDLALLGDGVEPDVAAILGDSITERATSTCAGGNSIHVRRNDGLLAFRPLRAGTTRALVAQLVAFDTDGKPHITPLVEGMELRLGNELSSPACVIQARPDGTLYPAQLGEIEEHAPFVRLHGDGVGCVKCHYQPNTMNARDLTADETRTIDIARTEQVEQLAAGVWKSLTEPIR